LLSDAQQMLSNEIGPDGSSGQFLSNEVAGFFMRIAMIGTGYVGLVSARSQPCARRRPARQDHRRAWPHLQARYRRHARSAVPLVTGLLDMGATVRAFDPVGIEQAQHELPNIEYCEETPVLEPTEARLCCAVGRAVVLGANRLQQPLEIGVLRYVAALPTGRTVCVLSLVTCPVDLKPRARAKSGEWALDLDPSLFLCQLFK